MFAIVKVDATKCQFNELRDTMRSSGRYDEIPRRGLAQHQPHSFHKIGRISPVANGFKVTKRKPSLSTDLDSGSC